MATEGRYSRTYEREFKAVLLSLPQTQIPGLANEAELHLISGTAAAWAIAAFRPLTDACQAGVPAMLQRCETVLVQGTGQLGEWGYWRAEMRAAGADEAALSAHYRRERGRGALDPNPDRR